MANAAFRSSSTATAASGSLSYPQPAGAAVGDFVLFAWTCFGAGTVGYASTMVGTTQNNQSGPDGEDTGFAGRILDGTETWPFIVTFSGGADRTGICVAFQNVDTGTPFDVTSSYTESQASNTTPISTSCSGISPSANSCLVWLANTDQTVAADRWSYSTPSGFTMREDVHSINWAHLALATQENFAGGFTGSVTATATRDSGTGNAGWAGYVIALRSNSAINANLGIATALGYQANVDINTTINCALGTAIAFGYVANVGSFTNIDCNLGTALAIGYQATIQGGDTTIDGHIGNATALGYQANVQYSITINANLGVATALGYSAIISNGGYGIVSDIQSLTPGALVEFFAIDLNPIGIAEQYFFHNGVNSLGNDVTWQGIVYTRFPIDADGFEWNGTGTQPRPSIRIANITGLIGALCRENDDMVGVKVTRKRTFLQYIDAVNFATGNPTADPNVHAPDEIWFIDRKVAENRVYVEWELRAGSDLTGKFLPARQCIQNTCLWKVFGGYRGANCSYTGPAVADINDMSTSDMALDNCGGRLSSCRLRFPQGNSIPFGGFPAIGLIK